MRLNFLLFLFVIFTFVCFSSCSVPIEQARNRIQPKTFLNENWNDDDFRWTYRPGMARDLIKRNVLIGKTRVEVVDLLGKSGLDVDINSNKMTYELDQLFQRGVDLAAVENLKITFNSNDTVEKAEIEFIKVDWR